MGIEAEIADGVRDQIRRGLLMGMTLLLILWLGVSAYAIVEVTADTGEPIKEKLVLAVLGFSHVGALIFGPLFALRAKRLWSGIGILVAVAALAPLLTIGFGTAIFNLFQP